MNSGKIEFFMEGSRPVLNLAEKSILLETADGVRVVNVESRKSILIPIKGVNKACLSPDSTPILAEIRRNMPFYAGGNLVVIDRKDNQKRHIISNDVIYEFLWTTSE